MTILLFKIGYPRKTEDYFPFLEIEICKITGDQIGRAGKLKTKGIRINNQIKTYLIATICSYFRLGIRMPHYSVKL